MAEKNLVMSDDAQFQTICGSYDENLKWIEARYHVSMVYRDNVLHVRGSDHEIDFACNVLTILLQYAAQGKPLDRRTVQYVAETVEDGSGETLSCLEENQNPVLCLTTSGKPVRPRTLGQQAYVRAMSTHTIVFGIGPAGTGKTYLAVAMAVRAFRNREVSKIILTRPAVEAGEKLGFLPGDMQEKVDPYLQPLYDSLQDFLGAETFQRHLERRTIEVAPLAYMRGRTLDHAYIILDEAQNTTREQMKMFLTRLGEDSRMVITGDVTQIDLPDKRRSGLVHASAVLADVDDIAICNLRDRDVVRHKLVQDIIRAYAKADDDGAAVSSASVTSMEM